MTAEKFAKWLRQDSPENVVPITRPRAIEAQRASLWTPPVDRRSAANRGQHPLMSDQQRVQSGDGGVAD